MSTKDEFWMAEAIKEAKKAYSEEEVPVGAVIVSDNRIIGRGHNRVESLKDPTAHAEMIAITAACNSKNDWRLDRSTIYVTLEPCLMCEWAISLSRIKRLVYGVKDERREKLNNSMEVKDGILKEECQNLLRSFFKNKR